MARNIPGAVDVEEDGARGSRARLVECPAADFDRISGGHSQGLLRIWSRVVQRVDAVVRAPQSRGEGVRPGVGLREDADLQPFHFPGEGTGSLYARVEALQDRGWLVLRAV